MKKYGLWTIPCLILIGCSSEAKFGGSEKKAYNVSAKYKHSFVASELVDGSQELTEDGRYGTDVITMQERSPTSQSTMQVARKKYQLTKKQGHDSIFSREEFNVSSAGLLDLLIVVDDSRSMAEEQVALGSKLEPLLSSIGDTNWQIAVISMSNPKVTSDNLILKGDPNYAKKFAKAVVKAIDTTAKEQGFPMAIQSLSASCQGCYSWTRKGSTVGVILVSDEDNCGSDPSEIGRCDRDKIYGKNAADMTEFLSSLRPEGQARVFSIVKENANSCPSAPGVGTEYLKAVVATGGVSGSICAADYGPTLSNISSNVNRIVKREFSLSGTPDMKEFKVEADGVLVTDPTAWSIVENKVSINPELFKTAKKISFTYTHDAVPKFDKFANVASVSPGSLVVKYNFIPQAESVYSYNKDKGEIYFTPMPPDDVVVDVSWREDAELVSQFSLSGQEIREDTLEVLVNGLVQDKSKYKFNGKEVSFAVPPVDGSVIRFKYKTEADKIDTYSIALIKEPSLVSAKDSVTQDEVVFTRSDKAIVFGRADVRAGRKINMLIDYGAKPSDLSIDLPEQAEDDSITVTLDGQDRGCKASNVHEAEAENVAKTQLMSVYLANDKSIIINCPSDMPDYTKVNIAYRYETPRKYEFEVPESVPLGDPKNPTEWKVYVNGIETKKFTREDRKIKIEESEIGKTAKIDVETIAWQKIEE